MTGFLNECQKHHGLLLVVMMLAVPGGDANEKAQSCTFYTHRLRGLDHSLEEAP